MTTENIDIIVNVKGTRVVRRDLKGIGDEAERTGRSVGLLKKALAAVGTAVLVREFKQYLDVNTELSNRLKIVTNSSEELAEVQDRLFKQAQETRASLRETVNGYARLSIAAQQLGISSEDTLRINELLNKSVAIGGSTGSEAAAGIRQFTQAIASGRLQGDELRSVLENLPGLAIQLAKGLNVSIGELRRLGEEGLLNPQKVLEALKSQGEEIDELFSRTEPTISQALTRLDNAFTKLIGDLDRSTGIAGSVASAISALAENVDVLAKALGALAIVIFSRVVASFILSTRQAILYQIALGRMAGVSALAATSQLSLAAATTAASRAFALLGGPIGIAVGLITAATFAFIEFRDQITTVAAELVNVVLDAFILFGINGEAAFKSLGTDLVIAFQKTANEIIGIAEKLTTTVADSLAKIPGFGGLSGGGQLPKFDIEATLASRANIEKDRLAAIAASSVGTDRFGIQDLLAARNAAGAGGAAADLTGTKGGAGSATKSSKELEQLLKAIDPVTAATKEYAEAQKLLNGALSSGLVTTEEYNRLNELLGASYQKVLDPFGALTDELRQEINLQKLSSKEREIQTQLLEAENTLRDQGVLITQQQRIALEELLRVRQTELNPGAFAEYQRSLEDVGSTIESSLVNGLRDASDSLAEFVLEGKNGLDSLGNSFKSLGKQILSLLIQQQLFGGPGITGGILGSIFGSAKGNAFVGGNIQAFAKGGIVDQPTFFGANNGMNVMGEAGSEAILPLTRMADGNLGVQAGGSSGSTVFAPNISVTVETRGDEDGQELGETIGGEIQRRVDSAFSDFIRRQQRPGGQLSGGGVY
jgi:tape measure domain-containing protein